MKLIWVIVGYLLLANGVTLAAFLWDKRQARKGGRRVPESALLQMSLLGGWPGAKLGQHWFRHKTRKQPFAARLNAIVGLHALLALGLFVAMIWTDRL